MRWILDVQQDENGDAFIEFPPDVLEGTGWKEGDDIEWIDNGDGSWTLKKKEKDMVWVMVDTISQYRMRYCVQVPSANPEWALDTVVMEEAKEFSQEWLGETIVSHRVVTEEEALRICRKDNSYIDGWDDELVKKNMFTHNGEKVQL
jgi:bifunctional DNA-binding transcriptional regulator/antitoxin component of YhaV-PrlF toxin-antitoxin module